MTNKTIKAFENNCITHCLKGRNMQTRTSESGARQITKFQDRYPLISKQDLPKEGEEFIDALLIEAEKQRIQA